jgi:lipopolysaccharide/colanic/teichoic acid biosynthesis glycosyltransferase
MDNSSIAMPSPAQAVPSSITSSHYAMVKRMLDVVLALGLLTIFAPVLLGAAVLVRLTSPGPIWFRQTRIGFGGREFQMLKLRTMYADADDRIHRDMNVHELLGDRAPPGTSDGVFRLQHDPRVTRIGRWLRRYGIDELPQLFNVLYGEMSLVGPRPSLPWEVEMYTAEQCRRHECLPGITGLWQVSDRYSLSMPEMLVLDLHYTDTRSLKLDIQILLRTPRAVLFDRSAR